MQVQTGSSQTLTQSLLVLVLLAQSQTYLELQVSAVATQRRHAGPVEAGLLMPLKALHQAQV